MPAVLTAAKEKLGPQHRRTTVISDMAIAPVAIGASEDKYGFGAVSQRLTLIRDRVINKTSLTEAQFALLGDAF
jgi:hypothetical protein